MLKLPTMNCVMILTLLVGIVFSQITDSGMNQPFSDSKPVFRMGNFNQGPSPLSAAAAAPQAEPPSLINSIGNNPRTNNQGDYGNTGYQPRRRLSLPPWLMLMLGLHIS